MVSFPFLIDHLWVLLSCPGYFVVRGFCRVLDRLPTWVVEWIDAAERWRDFRNHK